jgi:hypothetical protein
VKRLGVFGAVWFSLLGGAAVAQGDVGVERLERELATLQGELDRVVATQSKTPDIFAPIDREERATWGAVYHLGKQYDRAALALFGAVEAAPGASAVGAAQAESIFILADSLYELGNVGAARVYFERLLRLPRHEHLDDAILRLMAIAADEGRFDDVDRYYGEYVTVVGRDIPGQVRYLRARSLFLASRDDGALEEIGRIPTGDGWDLRARYLRTAILTRQGRLQDALGVVDDALKQPIKSVADEDVRELLVLARARLLYELDRLGDSIDAYQEIGLESRHLATMLYEVTLTYVRRGQLALRPVAGDGLTDVARRDRARREYKKALRQLEDLRALDDSGDNADVDLLAASLMLQVRDFDGAHERFADVVARFEAADREIQRLADDADVRARILQDILALERDPQATLMSPLPAVAARRAARQKDVARSLAAFKALQQARVETEELERLLGALERTLSPDNPARAEAFTSIRSSIERSQALVNATVSLRLRTLAAERAISRPSPALKERIDAIAAERAAVEQRMAAAPTTADAIEARRAAWSQQMEALERTIHESELVVGRLRAGALATAWLAQREPGLSPAQRESARLEAEQIGRDVIDAEATLERLKIEASNMKADLATAGGAGSGDEVLRQQLLAIIDRERGVLREVRDPARADVLARLDRTDAACVALLEKTRAFRARLDGTVDSQLADARSLLSTERQALNAYRGSLEGIEANAGDLRGQATAVALERVRREVSRIVLRGDVGIIDTAFARKQAETETISSLQRARALELTDLTQGYADLTRDELP